MKDMESIKVITPNDIPDIIKYKQKISSENYVPFKNRCIEYINEHIKCCDWFNGDNYTVEIPFSIWHNEFHNKILRNDVYKVFPEIVRELEDVGWNVFCS